MRMKLIKRKQKALKRMLFVVNPIAGKGLGKKYAFSLITFFSKKGYNVTVHPTDCDSETNKEFVKNNVLQLGLL